MNLLGRVTGVATSPHAGRALTVAKVLNFVGTVRGAVTTVLVLAGAAGGAATVTTVVQQDVVPAIERATGPAAPSTAPTATPLTAAGVREKAESTLKNALATNTKAADELRKVAVLSGAPLDQVIADTKRQLQQRYDQGLALIASLLEPAEGESTDPLSPGSVVVVNALQQVIADDLNRILVRATQAARGKPSEVALAPNIQPPAATADSTVRSEAEAKLHDALAATSRSVEALTGVSTLSAPQLHQLIVDAEQKLTTRHDQGVALLDALTADPTALPSASAVASLVQLITNDLNAIVRQTVLLATGGSPSPSPAAPGFAPALNVTRTPTAAPRTPTPAARTATPAPRTASPGAATLTPIPRTPSPAPTATPAPRTPSPAAATARPFATH